MSIFTRKISVAVLCAFVVSSPIFAQTTPDPQLTVAELSGKDIRRIKYYSAQTLEAMQAYGCNETGGGALAALRAKVQRLTDAGHRSGLTTNATAEYFAAFVVENSAAPLPATFLGNDGQFDAVSLLTSVELYFSKETPQALDVSATDEADMAALRSVARQATPQAPEAQSAEIGVAEVPAIVLETPEIAADTPANLRAILERVELKGNDWVITVQPGDSLALYANALYGDSQLFRKKFEANLEVLVTPNTIEVGQELILPKE